MTYYVGLDVSQKMTHVCVVDEAGKILHEASVKTHPFELGRYLQKRLTGEVKVGLETGCMMAWLHTGLTKMGFTVSCLDSVTLHRTLSCQRNKTDRNDARGIAEVMRMGPQWMKLVAVKSEASREVRVMLAARAKLVQQKLDLENELCGLLKPFGYVIARGNVSVATFRDRVMEALAHADDIGLRLRDAIVPLLDLQRNLAAQIAVYDQTLAKAAQDDPVCQKLMSVPGVGPVVALSFRASIDDPSRFKHSQDVGAYLGLTPKRFQSGDIDRMGRITKRGDNVCRLHLVQAATVLLTSVKKWSAIKAWGVKLAQKIGFNKAKIAVARKLATLLHAIWKNNSEFRWGKAETADVMVHGAA